MTYDDFVTFDLIGTKFRLTRDVFSRYPSSLFQSILLNSNDKKSDLPLGLIKVSSNEFFVQRSPELFQIVIKYCISHKLHLPKCACAQEVRDEFHFWQIKLESNCENCVNDYVIEEEIVDNDVNNQIVHEEQVRSTFSTYRHSLWTFLEHPHSSFGALVFNFVSITFILVAILNIILSSMPELQFCPLIADDHTVQEKHVQHHKKGEKFAADIDHRNDTEDLDAALFIAEDDFQYTECVGTLVFHIIDIVCISWFTFELVLRFISCPTLKKFFTKPLHYVDILAVIPFYVELILYLAGHNHRNMEKARVLLMFLRVLRIIRIFRVIKLARYSMSLQTLGKTLKSAKKEFGTLLIFVSLAVLIFSNFLYQFEKDVEDTGYPSIPASFWWCIVTLTTVGYGDVYPKTVPGKIVGGWACVCGILIVGFPIAILVEKFMSAYKREMKENLLRQHSEKKKSKYNRHVHDIPKEKLAINL